MWMEGVSIILGTTLSKLTKYSRQIFVGEIMFTVSILRDDSKRLSTICTAMSWNKQALWHSNLVAILLCTFSLAFGPIWHSLPHQHVDHFIEPMIFRKFPQWLFSLTPYWEEYFWSLEFLDDQSCHCWWRVYCVSPVLQISAFGYVGSQHPANVPWC
jgi:hypothetical protein